MPRAKFRREPSPESEAEVDRRPAVDPQQQAMWSASCLPRFDESLLPWEVYERRLLNSFELHNVPEGKRVLALLDEQTYSKVRDLCSPHCPEKKSLKVLLTLVSAHLNPVPNKYAKRVLRDLHDGHQGMVKTKQLARSYVWWPRIDLDIEKTINDCEACQQIRNNPPKEDQHRWEYPDRPMDRIHVDYAGPFKGSYFLLL